MNLFVLHTKLINLQVFCHCLQFKVQTLLSIRLFLWSGLNLTHHLLLLLNSLSGWPLLIACTKTILFPALCSVLQNPELTLSLSQSTSSFKADLSSHLFHVWLPTLCPGSAGHRPSWLLFSFQLVYEAFPLQLHLRHLQDMYQILSLLSSSRPQNSILHASRTSLISVQPMKSAWLLFWWQTQA